MDDIRKQFKNKIVNIVGELTNNSNVSNWVQVEHILWMSAEAKLVELCNKIDEIKFLLIDPPLTWTSEYIKGYVIHAYEVVSVLRGVNKRLEDEFDEIMTYLGVSDMSNAEINVTLSKFYHEMN